MSRYLVVAPQGLGDALEATPLVRELKRLAPAAAIDVAVLRGAARELFSGMPHLVSRVIELPYWERGSGAFLAELAKNARFGRYAASFLAYPAARREYHVLPLALGARQRFAHRYRRPTVANGLGCHTELVDVRPVHNVERNLDLLRAAGFAAQAGPYEVPAAWIAREAREPRALAVHVGTARHDGLDARRWAPERFVETIRRFRVRGFTVGVVAGPDEREVARAVAHASGAERLIEGSIASVARTLSRCAGMLANDSGIAHLAAGVGTPVLAIFGPTPVEHGPFGPHARAFRPTACAPCFDPVTLDTGCALALDYACLRNDATVDAVERAFDTLLTTAAGVLPNVRAAASGDWSCAS